MRQTKQMQSWDGQLSNSDLGQSSNMSMSRSHLESFASQNLYSQTSQTGMQNMHTAQSSQVSQSLQDGLITRIGLMRSMRVQQQGIPQDDWEGQSLIQHVGKDSYEMRIAGQMPPMCHIHNEKPVPVHQCEHIDCIAWSIHDD